MKPFRRFNGICCIPLITALSVSVTGNAQPAALSSTSPLILEEVTVTATRRAANVQDAGITVSALTGDGLSMRSVDNVADIALLTPGLNIASYQGDTSIFIRGIGTPTIIAGSDSSTATYVDGVFYSRAAAIGPAFFDIERVEVLRGPQGTLYGRNATGGAVNIISRGPGAEWQGEAALTLGNYSRRQLFTAVGGPLTDTLGARIAVQQETRDGYSTAIRADNSTDDIEDRDAISLRARLHWDISENIGLQLIADYHRADDKAAVFHFASTGYAEEIPGWYNSREGSQTLPYFAFRSGGRVSERASRDLFTDVEYNNKVDIQGITTRLDWRFAAVDVAVIANYKDTHPRLQNEFDSSDAFVNLYQREEDHWQRSIDIQLSSNTDSQFSWIAGATAFEEENTITNNIFGDFWEPILIAGLSDLQLAGVIPTFPIVLPQTTLCCTLQLNGEQQTEAWAVYFDGAYTINERFTLHVGGRHSWEERDGRQQFQLLLGGQRFAPNTLFFPNAVSAERNAVPDPFGFVVAPVNGPKDFSAFTPKLSLDYRIDDDRLLYVLVQKGFKTGGYNIGSNQLTAYQPEKILSYELGIKSELLDNRLRLNAALFNYRYKNLQAQDSVGNQPIIRNVGRAEVTGIELEFLAHIDHRWQLDGSMTYLDAEFTRGQLTEPLRPAPAGDAPGSLVRDLDGLRLTRAPRWQAHIGVQYQQPVNAMGLLTARLDYGWQSKVYYTVFNIDAASQDAYGVVNARLMLDSNDEHWSVAVFAKNLNDKTYFSNQILTGTVYGAEFVGSLAPPRTYGVEMAYRF